MQDAVPHPQIAPLLQEHFVALAADADHPEPAIIDLARHLEDAMMLPFVLFTDERGQFLDGYAGTSSPPYLRKTLLALTGQHE